MKLLITIIDRRLSERIIDVLEENAHYLTVSLGRGTASSELLDYLGIGESSKLVIQSFCNEQELETIFTRLNEFPEFMKHGGVAFTIPLTTIGKRFYDELTQPKEDKEEA